MKKEIKITENIAMRQLWFVLGLICLGLAVIGYILPVMPGTTFLLISAFCFAKSSKKWHDKLINNKSFGPIIKDYQEGKGMTRKVKITAITTVVASISISMYFASNFYVGIFLLLCAAFAIVCILKQKTKKE
jgi:uncharacterized membrane protein YbaN (DUF454 family)